MAKQLIAAFAAANRVARCWIGLSYVSLPFGDLVAIAASPGIAVRSDTFSAFDPIGAGEFITGRGFARPVGCYTLEHD
ncbi:MAG TPA: hypothetical protein VN831_20520, partial [Bradyrhizobium sp.]|nr:hypothetical protein [Bradyrhizobium sp.]